ncbi:MAG: PhoH family protein [Planctomycetota bacterium]|nr:PhoH family protein [Planctomycetota bacterium]
MELTISLPHGDERLGMTGSAERNLKIIRESLGVHIAARDGALRISGESRAVSQAAHILEQLSQAARRQQPMNRQQLLETIAQSSIHTGSHAGRQASGHASRDEAQRGPHAPRPHGDHVNDGIEVYLRSRQIKALTDGQRRYIQAIHQHDMTFCIGPAGTCKTYLAVAAAAGMLRRGEARKLVLVRPAVEAGERLGFLPGDMQQKVNPYLRPLLDALHDMMDFEQIQRFMACDLIEIVPLAFMRGRTLNDSLIILDEAQNATKQQMLMFLTRLGHGSKMIVTGDTTQIDLPDPTQSGLIDAARRLMRVPGIAFVTLEQTDIVRHNLVQRVVEAYGDQSRRRTEEAHGLDNQHGENHGDEVGDARDADDRRNPDSLR